MAIPPTADDSPLAEKETRDRLEMERDWQLRQENVLPLETAWNEGRFYGLLLKGSKPLSGVQRVGTLMVGFLALAMAFATYMVAGNLSGNGPFLEFGHQRFPILSLVWVPAVLLESTLGFRLCWIALRPPSRDLTHHTKPHNRTK